MGVLQEVIIIAYGQSVDMYSLSTAHCVYYLVIGGDRTDTGSYFRAILECTFGEALTALKTKIIKYN